LKSFSNSHIKFHVEFTTYRMFYAEVCTGSKLGIDLGTSFFKPITIVVASVKLIQHSEA